jgi:outer membrane protein assembly factor BamD (BamD/ComL family)
MAIVALAFLLALPLSVRADDARANEDISKALSAEKAGKTRDAADLYMSAQLQADNPTIKANSLFAAARNFRACGQLYKEFDCIERLINGHPGKFSFTEAVNREYEIGDEYFAGHRDVPFSFLPFIKDENKCVDIYETALRNAPCAERAPETRLRLGRLYLDAQKPDKAIKCFKDTIKLHPGTPSAKYASLELCNTLLQLSRRGDGDGKYSGQALEAFDQFLAAYPGDPSKAWVERAKEEVKGIIAKRLNGLASYYHRLGKDEVAERYLTQVIKEYPGTEPVNKSEDMLASIDQSYKIAPDRKEYMEEPRFYQHKLIPSQEAPIIAVPENSDGKWLLPIKDLKYGVKYDNRQGPPKKEPGKDDSL